MESMWACACELHMWFACVARLLTQSCFQNINILSWIISTLVDNLQMGNMVRIKVIIINNYTINFLNPFTPKI